MIPEKNSDAGLIFNSLSIPAGNGRNNEVIDFWILRSTSSIISRHWMTHEIEGFCWFRVNMWHIGLAERAELIPPVSCPGSAVQKCWSVANRIDWPLTCVCVLLEAVLAYVTHAWLIQWKLAANGRPEMDSSWWDWVMSSSDDGTDNYIWLEGSFLVLLDETGINGLCAVQTADAAESLNCDRWAASQGFNLLAKL